MPSIAVLAFTNMSGDPEQEFFSDGITEDIITELSRRRLVNERGRVFKSLQADLQAVAPGLLQITRDVGNQWLRTSGLI